MIQIRDLSFSYEKKKLFSGLNLELEPGLYGLLGKNGAGKSSLLKLIAGELFRHGGECMAAGYDSGKRSPMMLSEIYYLPEEFDLPAMTGDRYIESYSPFYPRFSRDFFDECAAEFEVSAVQKLSTMSYGQKKKFMIAFGLATWSSILLLDEPTNGLDIPSKSQFRRLVAAGASDERLILVSTHQVRDMENLIDPIVIVEDGKIIFNHTMEDVTSSLDLVLTDKQPAEGEAVYSEKVLGGWLCAVKSGEGSGREFDLEFLFNMVISCSDSLEAIIDGGSK